MVITITGKAAYAQSAGNLFDLSSHYFKYRYLIPLENKEIMQVEVTRKSDLRLLKNTDTIIREYVKELQVLQDSLAEEIQSNRIDFLIQDNSVRKFRLHPLVIRPTQYVMLNGTPALLKTTQDTVTITAVLSRGTGAASIDDVRYVRLTFFMNSLNNMKTYSFFQDKVDALVVNSSTAKFKNQQLAMRYKKELDMPDPEPNKLLVFRGSVDVQNYKNFFVPSNTIGFAFIQKTDKRIDDIGLSGELHFIFKEEAGKLQTYKNVFVTFSYESTLLKEAGKPFSGRYFSIGYRVTGEGNFYEKNAFKLTTGQFSFQNGTTLLQPVFYFSNFFKNITPSLRIVQRF